MPHMSKFLEDLGYDKKDITFLFAYSRKLGIDPGEMREQLIYNNIEYFDEIFNDKIPRLRKELNEWR